jgi:hypothetical protein
VTTWTGKRSIAIAFAAAAGVGLLAAPGTAGADDAAPAATLNVAYDASGTSTIAKTGSSVALGPTTLTTAINPDGTFTGHLPLPPTSTSFKALGLLPTTATVSFIEAAPLSGVLKSNPKPTITSTASVYIKLSDVTVAGLPALVGDHCQTADPVSIPAATPAGQVFNVTTGGTLEGTFTVGNFENCGLTTPLLNLLVPGPDNTVTLQLTNGRIIH